MSKIMIVEDDNNLREIYGERLLAEGYEIVSASDGEEALALAIKEKPDLIVADVMMPKISGFDMLDILRQTPETKDTKVVMMTALSQTEDKLRADKLGANKYLVKSQVTLEDVVRVVHDLLASDEPAEIKDDNDTDGPAVTTIPVTSAPDTSTPATGSEPAKQPLSGQPPTASSSQPVGLDDTAVKPEPAAPQAAPVPVNVTQTTASVSSTPPADTTSAISTADEVASIAKQINNFTNQADTAGAKQAPIVAATQDTLEPASARKKVIEPINDLPKQPDINELYQKELAAEAAQSVANPEVSSTPKATPKTPNPISSESPETATEPLETIDASQISGLTPSDDAQPTSSTATPPTDPNGKIPGEPNLDQIAL